MKQFAGIIIGVLVLLSLKGNCQNLSKMPTGRKFYIQSALNHGKNNEGYWDIPGKPSDITKGSNIQVWSFDNNHDRKYTLIKSSEDGYYEIKIGNTQNSRIDISGNKTANGTNVATWTRNGKSNQKFGFQHLGGGKYKIYERSSGKVLCLKGKSSANGSNVHIWSDNSDPSSEWYVIDAETRKPILPSTFTNDVSANSSQSTVVDFDGNTYKTKQFGDITWMVEELKVTHYNDGTPIPNVTDLKQWDELTNGAFAWYDNEIMNKKYGAIYNHYAVQTEKLCPLGWRVPSLDEAVLIWGYHIGYGDKQFPATTMKSPEGWDEKYFDSSTKTYKPHVATNKFGFSAKPTPTITYGAFSFGKNYATYWLSNHDTKNAYYLGISILPEMVLSTEKYRINFMVEGKTVRCVKKL